MTTKRQAEVLAFIRDFQASHGYAPSYREIGEAFNLTAMANIHRILHILRQRGLIRFRDAAKRSVEIITSDYDRGYQDGLRDGMTRMQNKFSGGAGRVR